ncbi:hypothetical protein EYC84_002742 [Monilinia fructicola]|uniref:Wax synthase domain-containing protein n=1 Tax=Monilinia fructicola TaxID=38448 RepID=A0A5M9JMI4_MONFR|nr:hypothetical protein EYC84_002742 [Monilinia fructicola]
MNASSSLPFPIPTTLSPAFETLGILLLRSVPSNSWTYMPGISHSRSSKMTLQPINMPFSSSLKCAMNLSRLISSASLARRKPFNEPLQFVIHAAIFCALQALPQDWALVLAFEVQLSIYLIWTGIQLLVRYKSSPALFWAIVCCRELGRLLVQNMAHNVFSAPCASLAYDPLRKSLPKLGVPGPDRSIGGNPGGFFFLMAVFHVYALAPMLTDKALLRIGMFFVLNGFATVGEALVWGRRESWVKTGLAWVTEMSLGGLDSRRAGIPRGVHGIRVGELCGVKV